MTAIPTDQEIHLATVQAMWADLIRNPLDDGLKGMLADYVEDHWDALDGVAVSSLFTFRGIAKDIRAYQDKEVVPDYVGYFPRFQNPSIYIRSFDGLPAQAEVTFESLSLLVDAVREFPIKRVEMPEVRVAEQAPLCYQVLRGDVDQLADYFGFQRMGLSIDFRVLRDIYVMLVTRNRSENECRHYLSTFFLNLARHQAGLPLIQIPAPWN